MSLSETNHLSTIATDLIDSDHGELAQRVEAVRIAMAIGDFARVDGALRKLRDFALTHYGLEEGIMIASEYPHTREHIRMHQRLIGVLNGMMYRTGYEGMALQPQTLQAIEDLHSMHIRTDDARLEQWLHRRPV
jgi:hemerythrin-like metal-binding protein